MRIKRTKLKKELNKYYGIDWEKPDKIKYNCLKGKQTLFSIAKKLDLKKENLNIVFIRYKNKLTNDSYFEGFQYEKDDLTKFFIPDWRGTCSLMPFYNKTDVLTALKRASFVHVFQVEPDALNEVKKIKLDERLFYNDDLNFRVKIDGTAYINSQNLRSNIDVMINGKKHRLDIGFMHGNIGTLKNYTLKEFVDKSGYSLVNHRNKLNSRLCAKRHKTLENAIINHKFDKKNDDLFYNIIELKDLVSNSLSRARNSYRIKLCSNWLDACAVFMEQYETHEQFIKNVFNENTHRLRMYHSIKEVYDAIDELNEKIRIYKDGILKG